MTQPGWYPDPDDPRARRYFDGQSWSAPLTDADNPPRGPRRSSMMLGILGAAVVVIAAVVALIAWAPWSDDSGSPQSVVRITDPAVAKSEVASQFITDLYNADHGSYWRTRPQGVLVDQAGIDCVSGMQPADLSSQFPGLADPGIQEFVTLTNRDICSKMTANYQIPGYDTG